MDPPIGVKRGQPSTRTTCADRRSAEFCAQTAVNASESAFVLHRWHAPLTDFVR
jgi:hypothetical protein